MRSPEGPELVQWPLIGARELVQGQGPQGLAWRPLLAQAQVARREQGLAWRQVEQVQVSWRALELAWRPLEQLLVPRWAQGLTWRALGQTGVRQQLLQ